METEGHAQDRRFVGGSPVVVERLAAHGSPTSGSRSPGRARRPGREGVRVDGLRARHAVVAMAPALAGRLRYDPPLPAARDQLTQRTPNGSVIKAMCVYPEPFWRADGLSGQAAATDGPVRVIFDNSPHGSAKGVLLGFFEAAPGAGVEPADGGGAPARC